MNFPHSLSLLKVMLPLVALVVSTSDPRADAPRFNPDDPRPFDLELKDASGVRAAEPSPVLVGLRTILRHGDRRAGRASNVNSQDEVPDSSWFTNRIGSRPLPNRDIAQGPNTLPEPLSGPWLVLSGKTDGVTPGLQLKDADGRRFFVKFDPVSNPEMASGAEVIATKLLYALGYNVPENYIATLRREQLTIDPEATFTGPDGRKRTMSPADVDRVLQHVARRADGSYRMLASLRIEGRIVGPFQYFGTRPDDPNDVVAHEHRRELRGLRVFAAWLNHVDTKSHNSLDALVAVQDRTIVRHYLIDFGSALGSAGTGPKDWRDGFESGFDGRTSLLALLSFGTHTPWWRRIHFPDLPAVGRIEGDRFQPARWKPTLPNPAFANARGDDLFWAAQRVMAFSDEAIRAVVATARFSDPGATRYLTDVLIKRRDQIGREWLTAVNPIAGPSIDRERRLVFRNAAVDAHLSNPPAVYQVRWFVFDNTTRAMAPLGPWRFVADTSCEVPIDVPPSEPFIVAALAVSDPQHPSWADPVLVYLRRDAVQSWTLVGFERLPPGD